MTSSFSEEKKWGNSQKFLVILTNLYFYDLILNGLEACSLNFSRKKLLKNQGKMLGQG